MKYLTITLIVCILTGCETKKTKDRIQVEKTEVIDSTTITEAITKVDTTFFSLLKSNQIISKSYPEASIKVLNTQAIEENKEFSAIKFPYDSTLKELYESELIFNAIILHNENEIINAHVIDAVDEEDFSLLYSTEHYLIYEFYSSPVGYTIYYIFTNKNKQLLKSEPVEEGFAIDTSKINFERYSIQTSFNKNYKEYTLTKVW